MSGHTSGIDSVSFDSSEVLVAAGAASGTIKLWDLEEAKSMFLHLQKLNLLAKTFMLDGATCFSFEMLFSLQLYAHLPVTDPIVYLWTFILLGSSLHLALWTQISRYGISERRGVFTHTRAILEELMQSDLPQMGVGLCPVERTTL